MTKGHGITLDGARLRRQRIALGLTQEQVAESAGVTNRTVQTAERGRRVSADTARRLVTALGLPLAMMASLAADEIVGRLEACGCSPPPPPRLWAGRRAELARLRHWLAAERDGARLTVAVTGAPGIGKSALARVVARDEAGRHGGRVVWLALRRRRVSPGPFATQLALARAMGFAERLPSPASLAPEAWQRAFNAHLWQAPLLLILDDVEDALDIEQLQPDRGGHRILVTTARRSVAERLADHALELGRLSPEEGLALLRLGVGAERVAAEAEPAGRLVEYLGGSPRDLQIAAAHLHRHRYLTCSDYLALVSQDRGAADAPTAPPVELPPEEATFHGAAIALTRRLTARARAGYAALSLLEGHPFALDWGVAAVGGGEPAARAVLSELTDAFLVEDRRPGPPDGGYDEVGPFQLDAQSQRIAARLRDEGERRAALARLVEHALERARRSSGSAAPDAAWIGREFGPFSIVFDQLQRAAFPAPSGAPAGDDPADLDRLSPLDLAAAEQLGTLMRAFGRRLAALAPLETTRWLASACAAAHATRDSLAEGELAHMVGHAKAHCIDFRGARAWHGRAVEAYAAADAQTKAGLAAIDLARMAFIATMDARTCVEELESACQRLESEPARTCLRAAARMTQAAALLHDPAATDAWPRAEALFRVALAQGPACEPDEFSAAVRAIGTIDLAVICTQTGGEPPAEPALAAAVAHVHALVQDDALDCHRLHDMAREVGLSPRRCRAIFGARQPLRAVILECPPEIVGRRIIRLHEIAHGLVDLAAGPASPFRNPRMQVVSGGTTITDVGYGRTFALADVCPPLLMPVVPLAAAWTPEVRDSACAFVHHTFGPGHPVLALLRATTPAAPLVRTATRRPGRRS